MPFTDMNHCFVKDSRRRGGPLVTAVASLLAVVWLSSTALAADPYRGGRLYDKWWAVNGAPAPTGDHALYPPVGQKTGSTTHRCKECHGWDYKGAAGAYGAGSHFTGIIGVLGSVLTPAEMFDIIKNPDGDGTGGTTVNGHDFGNIGLADADIDDLVDFLQGFLIDTDVYIDSNGAFIGDELQGLDNYTLIGTPPCVSCHGADGRTINFGTPASPEWVGTVAAENPWEMMHKVRFGQPGSNPQMPTWLLGPGAGQGDQGVADVGKYIQLNLPAGPPVPTLSEWGTVAAAVLLMLAGFWVLDTRRRRQLGRQSG